MKVAAYTNYYNNSTRARVDSRNRCTILYNFFLDVQNDYISFCCLQYLSFNICFLLLKILYSKLHFTYTEKNKVYKTHLSVKTQNREFILFIIKTELNFCSLKWTKINLESCRFLLFTILIKNILTWKIATFNKSQKRKKLL